MKRLLCVLTLGAISYVANAQIFATTSAGKKVILNTVDGTWKYASGNEAENPCLTKETASFEITNKHGADFYFYYTNGLGDKQYSKIPKGEKKIINNISVPFNGRSFSWVASDELQDVRQSNGLYDIKGFEKGNIEVAPCDGIKIEIY